MGISFRLVISMALLLATISAAFSRVEVASFEDPSRQALYQEMISELRCLVCQNQNLADSNAELAQDLRQRTRELIEDGKSREEIVDYMVARYGDFVLYRPRLTPATVFLWFSPIVLFLFLVWWVIRWRMRATVSDTGYSELELQRARSLLSEQKPGFRSEPSAKKK